MSNVIDNFRGEYFFLSNFYMRNIETVNGVFPSVEHMFMAEKSTSTEDYEMIRQSSSPKEARQIGRIIELRSDWEDVKDEIMYEACYYKFSQHEDLRQRLLATDDKVLVEGNKWGDDYWGKCTPNGKNVLGKILMRVREELR